MFAKFSGILLLCCLSICVFATPQDDKPQVPTPPNGGDFSQNADPRAAVPPGILVKTTVPSATDASTPLPEGGIVVDNIYRSSYFGITYPFPSGWIQRTSGPPPSDSGYYVLSQVRPSDAIKANVKGSMLIAAQDLFFPLAPVGNTTELIAYTKNHLMPEYQAERQPTEVKIANHSFIRFDYEAPVAQLHWSVLATQIRCHTVEFVITSRDPKLLESMIADMNKMKLPAEAGITTGAGGDEFPVCIKDYATGARVTHKVEPVLLDRRFNSIPVRITISKTGTVKHIHFLSALPDQAKAITDALLQWTFKPYLRNGVPAEVETGITFGFVQQQRDAARPATSMTNE